jgi:5-methylcytosine-specific restriction endonuclease McrA
MTKTLDGADWREAYDRYRQTPLWAEKRRLVLERAKRICEGCGVRRASEVHHLRYPSGALPGSDDWLRSEKLFDLVALCEGCHQDLHPAKLLSLALFGG